MKYLWILTLLFMGCDKDPVTTATEVVYGCTDYTACNFNTEATIYVPNSCEYLENCALCSGLTEVELWGVTYDIGSTTSLILTGQELTGSISPEIGCLTNLRRLDLWGTRLTGEIPPEIGDLTNLTELYIPYNQLTGEIPSEIGNLTNLQVLQLSENQFTGEIPPEIGNLTNLAHLVLFQNQLTGEIPQEVCDLIESNNWESWRIEAEILNGNNLINTCE